MQDDVYALQTVEKPDRALQYHGRYRNEELVKYLPYRRGMAILDYPWHSGLASGLYRGWHGSPWGVSTTLPGPDPLGRPERITVAAVQSLPFADETFDAVVYRRAGTSDVDLPAGWLSSPEPLPASLERVLGELVRVLRPGGRLVLWETSRSVRRLGRKRLASLLSAVGLVLVEQEPFDYLAYPVAALTERFPLLAVSSLTKVLVEGLLTVDSLLARVPALRTLSWHLILVMEKPYVRVYKP